MTAEQMGINTVFKISIEAPLIFISLFIFKKQVKKFEKYIIAIKPFMPKKGKIAMISPILKDESNIPVLKQKFC